MGGVEASLIVVFGGVVSGRGVEKEASNQSRGSSRQPRALNN